MEKIRAIIIDPNKGTITEEMIVPSLQEFYRIIGCDHIEMFTRSPFLQQTSHFLYIDEEGSFKPDSKYFVVAGFPQPIKGIAILMKMKPPVEVSATLPVSTVEINVMFELSVKI